MSEMVKRFDSSDKPRPKEARQIPNLAVNFVDINNKFQDGFTLNSKVGDKSKFTATALEWYGDEVKNIVVPPSFVPVENGVTLHRWGPTKKYYNPGGTSSV